MAVSAPERPPARVDGGVIEEARLRRRSRRLRSAGVVFVAAVGVLLAVIAAAGTASKAPARLKSDSAAASAHYNGSLRVSLSPNLEPGRPGWCVAAAVHEVALGFGCDTLLTRAHPFLGEGWAWARGSRYATRLVLTPPHVRSILFNGSSVPTRSVQGVPFGLRVAVLERPIRPRGTLLYPEVTTVSGRSSREGAETREAMPVRYWKQPEAPPRGVCELHASPLSGLTNKWGGVVTVIRDTPGQLLGDGFLPCVDAGYWLDGYAVHAAVLLDASQPGHKLPAIPGLIEIPRQPGVYNTAPNLGYAEPVTAKRQGHAWIVVAGGGRNAEHTRLTLLRRLTATVRL